MTGLDSLSPLDGRYLETVRELRTYFSESALIRQRIFIELRYLIALSEAGVCRQLTTDELALLTRIEESLHTEEMSRVKEIEKETNHDVKACEYWLRERFAENSLKELVSFLHLGLTSSDVNDTAYALMLLSATREVMFPIAMELKAHLTALAKEHAGLAMLSRTHGQPASPTTVGKEFAVFSSRIDRQLEQLRKFTPTSKLSGATGTYAAQHIAAPDVDWPGFAEEFLSSLGLQMSSLATQIDSKDSFAELFGILRRLNAVCIDLSRDCWLYISLGYLAQNPKEGEVGSSTMPHKVNPIDFENAEGNLELANSLLVFLSEKLTKSRLQRDLSDSTVMRNMGVALGHSLLAWKALLKGLDKVAPDAEALAADLKKHPEVLAEAVQTVMRKHGMPEAYEQLKALTRGKGLTVAELRDFILGLELPPDVKEKLLTLEPENYTGLAEKLANPLEKDIEG